MKTSILILFVIFICAQISFAQKSTIEQEIIKLPKGKWQWMSENNIDTLSDLLHEKSVFVHLGGAWGKEPGLNVIKSGGIW